MISTLNSRLTDAELCHENAWQVGTMLTGSEGYGPETIIITAIGEVNILARRLGTPMDKLRNDETNWTLKHRNWRKVDHL